MCGIIGFYSERKRPGEIKILSKLMEESSIRGIHSFGAAYFSGNKIKIKKSRVLTRPELINGFVSDEKSNRFIFHCRYSTSGDFENMDNNPPIYANGAAIVMNGVISMKKKRGFEKEFKVKCKTENDSEIILRKDYLTFLKTNPKMSFAGIILKGNKLNILRNNKRPLYRFDYYGATFIVSTVDIAYRSGIPIEKIIPIQQMKLITI